MKRGCLINGIPLSLAAKYQTLSFIDSDDSLGQGSVILCKIYGSPQDWGQDGLVTLMVNYLNNINATL